MFSPPDICINTPDQSSSPGYCLHNFQLQNYIWNEPTFIYLITTKNKINYLIFSFLVNKYDKGHKTNQVYKVYC